MANLLRFNVLSRDLTKGVHNFQSDTFKVLLSNVAPAAGNQLKADITEIAAGFGYTAGGLAVTVTISLSGAVEKIVIADKTITATGGTIGPFRYAVIYNDTATGDVLVCYVDLGSAISILDGDQMVLDFDATAGAFTIG